jgi:hypothetical protein
LGHTVRVAEGNTDLGRGEALTGEFDDLLDDLLGSGLEPDGGCAAVGESGGRWGPCKYSVPLLQSFLHIQMPFPGACMRPMANSGEESVKFIKRTSGNVQVLVES